VDKTGVMKKWSKLLHDASYKAKIYHREVKSRFPDCNLSKKLQKAAENIDRSRLSTSGLIIEVPKLVEKRFLAQTKLYEWYLKCVPYNVDLSPAAFSTAFTSFWATTAYFFVAATYFSQKDGNLVFLLRGNLKIYCYIYSIITHIWPASYVRKNPRFRAIKDALHSQSSSRLCSSSQL